MPEAIIFKLADSDAEEKTRSFGPTRRDNSAINSR